MMVLLGLSEQAVYNECSPAIIHRIVFWENQKANAERVRAIQPPKAT